MEGFAREDVRFEEVARQTLRELLGDSPYEALSVLIGSDGLSDPSVFTSRLRGILSSGAVSICNLIEKKAAEAVPSPTSIPEVVSFEEAASNHVESERTAQPSRKRHYLHDHRMPDELEIYRSKLAE